MIGTVYIKGRPYHTDPNSDEDVPLYENGELVPKHLCLCAAYSSNECICGAWDTPIPEGDDNE